MKAGKQRRRSRLQGKCAGKSVRKQQLELKQNANSSAIVYPYKTKLKTKNKINIKDKVVSNTAFSVLTSLIGRDWEQN